MSRTITNKKYLSKKHKQQTYKVVKVVCPNCLHHFKYYSTDNDKQQVTPTKDTIKESSIVRPVAVYQASQSPVKKQDRKDINQLLEEINRDKIHGLEKLIILNKLSRLKEMKPQDQDGGFEIVVRNEYKEISNREQIASPKMQNISIREEEPILKKNKNSNYPPGLIQFHIFLPLLAQWLDRSKESIDFPSYLKHLLAQLIFI